MFARILVAVVLVMASTARAAEEPSRLRCPTPEGWTRAADGPSLLPAGGGAAVTFSPSIPFKGTGEQWMDEAWKGLLAEFTLVAGPAPGTQGGFLSRIGLFQQADGTKVWICLNTLVKEGRGEAVILVAADETTFQAQLAPLSRLLANTTVGSPAVADAPAAKDAAPPATAAKSKKDAGTDGGAPASSPPPAAGRKPGLGDYMFLAPEGWQVQRKADQILVTQSPDLTGCLVQMLPPQPSSRDLQKDASAVFDMMYAGWQPKQYAAEKFVLSTGFLPKGLEFCMLEAAMERTTPDGRYETEEGAALVVGLGDQVAILAVRHRGTFGHAEGCLRKYTTWRRFFNSFGVNGAPASGRSDPPLSERIIGRWSMREMGAASAEYVFAANGNYAFSGAIGSSHTTTDYRYEYLYLKTYAFSGDGSYALSGNELTLSRRSTGEVERKQIRFEKVNRGGAGWVDRMYLLGNDSWGENEVRYEKQTN